MSWRERLPIIQFRRRRHLRKTVVENTEVNMDLSLPAKHVKVYKLTLSRFSFY